MLFAGFDAALYEPYYTSMERTKVELLRLQQHPELFPDEDARKEFWRHVHSSSTTMIDLAVSTILARDDEHLSLNQLTAKIYQAHLLPTEDRSRNSWEQFFHHKVPGSGLDLSAMTSEGSIQVLPHAGYRILTTINNEDLAIVQGIEAVCNHKTYPSRQLDPSS